jgi:lactate dehydrogenase-like 2-hydroxyacid dehydrogenase
MDIVILFPKHFFTPEQLKKLNKYNLKFIEGKNLDLDKLKESYSSKELILAIDPTYSKDSWGSLTVERVKRMKGFRALCLTTTSYSWVDLEAMKKLGVIVTNTPGKSTEAVAEFNIYMMLALLRKTPFIIKNKWNMDYDNFTNEEAKGKTAGIVGLGKIGQRVG